MCCLTYYHLCYMLYMTLIHEMLRKKGKATQERQHRKGKCIHEMLRKKGKATQQQQNLPKAVIFQRKKSASGATRTHDRLFILHARTCTCLSGLPFFPSYSYIASVLHVHVCVMYFHVHVCLCENPSDQSVTC